MNITFHCRIRSVFSQVKTMLKFIFNVTKLSKKNVTDAVIKIQALIYTFLILLVLILKKKMHQGLNYYNDNDHDNDIYTSILNCSFMGLF